MPEDAELSAIIADLGQFFERAKPDDDFNAGLAAPFIKRWGTKFAMMSAAYVVDDIQRSPMFLSGAMVIASSMMNVGVAQSLYKAYRGDAAHIAASAMATASDEDCLAIHSYMLASNDFASPMWQQPIRQTIQKVVGSSCKLMLAFALHKCGDSGELMQLFRSGYLCPVFMAEGMLQSAKSDHPGLSDEQAKNVVLDWFAINGVPRVMGVFSTFVLDVWSRGEFAHEGYLSLVPWKRKVYND